MLLRAGLVSIALLLASRLLGLLRESVQAAALGATGLADVAILMLTLPDLLTGILASGALSYVLLPLWARQSPHAQAVTRARLSRILLVSGLVVGALMVVAPQVITQALAPGLSDSAGHTAHSALRWSALAMPLALVAALGTTRLQHLRDFTGMYGANLVVNAAIVAGLLLILQGGDHLRAPPVTVLGAGLVLGMGLRLVWQGWRARRAALASPALPDRPVPPQDVDGPRTPVWLWALASAGLPLMLPLLGRSLASSAGEGALTTFNYAWKLVELPLVLAVQLVATLAFPGIAQAFSHGTAPATEAQRTRQRDALRSAFVLAWVLACAAAAALSGMAPALAQLLFGWGRMTPEAVAGVGTWSRVGAWSLLPQALLAVLLTLMASTGRLRGAVAAYMGALCLLALLGWLGGQAPGADAGARGEQVMWAINAALSVAAAALLLRERDFLRGVLRGRDLLPALGSALALGFAARFLDPPGRLQGLLLALGMAVTVVAVSVMFSPGLRQALRR